MFWPLALNISHLYMYFQLSISTISLVGYLLSSCAVKILNMAPHTPLYTNPQSNTLALLAFCLDLAVKSG